MLGCRPSLVSLLVLLPSIAHGIRSQLDQLESLELGFDTPEIQTNAQKIAFRRHQAKAKVASEAATPRLLEFFDSAGFRQSIQDCCPETAKMSAVEILEHFRAEVRHAELPHSFPTGEGHSITLGHHFHTGLGMKYNWLLNRYQAAMVTADSTSSEDQVNNSAITPVWVDLAETGMYGCPEFQNPESPTWTEAADRVIYVALNLRQLDTGSVPTFGDATAVFSNSYVKDMVLLSPVDTGWWQFNCNHSSNMDNSVHHPPEFALSCSSWSPPVVGTMDYHDHVILASIETWPVGSGPLQSSSKYVEAAKLFERSAFSSAGYENLPSIDLLSQMKYIESNLLGNPRFPEGVRFLIGNFCSLFGTAGGLSLQKFAKKYGWPLLWAQGGPLDATMWERRIPGNGRVLDPTVDPARPLNITLPKESAPNFWSAWSKMHNQRQSDENFCSEATASDGRVAAMWSDFSKHQLRLAPVTSRTCSDIEACIGTELSSGICICHGSDAS